MADQGPSAGAQLPPPPQPNAGAPGYENGQNGQSNPAHMPPPPLHIPANTNPIPTAVTSPMTGDQLMSPNTPGGFMRRAAPEPNKRALYVGGLDPRVTEDVLRQIFETTGHVQNVKIIPDKNVSLILDMFVPETIVAFYALARHAADLVFCRPRVTTTGSSSTTTPVRPREPCRH